MHIFWREALQAIRTEKIVGGLNWEEKERGRGKGNEALVQTRWFRWFIDLNEEGWEETGGGESDLTHLNGYQVGRLTYEIKPRREIMKI